VINLSLSGPPDRLLAHLLDLALERGITVVAAVDPQHPDGGFPASHHGVIAVAADHVGATGTDCLRAPGQDIPSTAPGARWTFVSGASFAAAHVSGLLALLEELRPDQPAARAILAQAGSIDACAAVARTTGSCLCACTTMTVLPSLP
jgi:subtilisin family serine protease